MTQYVETQPDIYPGDLQGEIARKITSSYAVLNDICYDLARKVRDDQRINQSEVLDRLGDNFGLKRTSGVTDKFFRKCLQFARGLHETRGSLVGINYGLALLGDTYWGEGVGVITASKRAQENYSNPKCFALDINIFTPEYGFYIPDQEQGTVTVGKMKGPYDSFYTDMIWILKFMAGIEQTIYEVRVYGMIGPTEKEVWLPVDITKFHGG